MTEKDKYKPTAAEKRLLEVLINPDYLGKNVTELCNLAGISRNKYYDAMKKKDFQSLVADTTQELIKGKIGDVLNATYKYSLTAKGHQDRKVLLTMAGLYVDKKETEISGGLDIANTSTEIGKYLSGSDSL
ncbi:phBC6A51 family helix-turn-helix protein [Enterococcus pseudoavium]|uniref:PhBC6A51 family helix-turn-helix protein n=1 Tax=Enterococcus pseudoavium TaxID=44007 RepID=A0AAE4I385_9ENTE|nr:phBC6A51 family helix-turn-helix protein [Enterococcus pseudoavium]MDT2737653.1 phBC6A51 family helix-turn-helix protein [Enterococcus pseudoavium]